MPSKLHQRAALFVSNLMNRHGLSNKAELTCPDVRAIAEALEEEEQPFPIILHCPRCHQQHVDEIDEVNNPGWLNPPHTSHKCLTPGCDTIWRPADYPTEGVRNIQSMGKSDNWPE